MRRPRRVIMRRVLVLVLLGAAGCASEYVYEPAEHATATESGYPAADYGIPPQNPEGDVRVVSYGVTHLAEEGGQRTRVLQVRLIVANNADAEPWVLDTRQVLAWIPGEGRSAPAFVNSGMPEELPLVHVTRGEERTVDLYYPLPQGMQSPSKIPEFDVTWSLQTGMGQVAERTPFERLRVELPPDDYEGPYWDWGGAYWWYDPFYPTVAFAHPALMGRPWGGGRISVGRPSWHGGGGRIGGGGRMGGGARMGGGGVRR
jgi:hypothetical protein